MATARKVIIIGAGPAGYTAAIYAARANLAPLLFTGLQAGGQLTLTTSVENYPGFVDGVMGPDLMETMRKQAERFGTEIVGEDVTAVDFARRPFRGERRGGHARGGDRDHGHRRHREAARPAGRARADGPRDLDLRDLRRLLLPRPGHHGGGRRRFRAGGGALSGAPGTPRGRRASTRQPARLQDHAGARPGQPEDLVHLGHRRRADRRSRDRQGDRGDAAQPQDRRGQRAQGRRPVRRHRPHAQHRHCCSGQVELLPNGYVKVEPGTTRTSVPGVFAAGDVADFTWRQASPRPAPAAWPRSRPSATSRSRRGALEVASAR